MNKKEIQILVLSSNTAIAKNRLMHIKKILEVLGSDIKSYAFEHIRVNINKNKVCIYFWTSKTMFTNMCGMRFDFIINGDHSLDDRTRKSLFNCILPVLWPNNEYLERLVE